MIYSPLGIRRQRVNCADQSRLFLLKFLAFQMLQLRLAVRRCAGLDRVSTPRTIRLMASPILNTTTRWYSISSPPVDLSEGEREIYQKLTDKFSPTALRVQDISGTHIWIPVIYSS